MGSEHAQRPEVGQLSRSFQLKKQTLNRIRERSGRPDITHDVQDKRKTSRSQEIDVNSFCEKPSFSAVTRPIPGKAVHEKSVSKHVHLKTERISMLNRYMKERGDLLSRMT